MDDAIILSFELPNYEDSQKKIDEYTQSIFMLRNEIKENTSTNKALAKENEKLQKQMKTETKDRITLQKQIDANNKKMKENVIASARLKDKVSELNKSRRDEIKISKIQQGSLEETRKKVSLLFKERDKLDLQTLKGQRRFDALTKEIKQYQEEIQTADRSAGVFTSSIGNYTQGMKEAIYQTGLMSSPLGRLVAGLISVKNAIGLNIKSLGALKIALMSTGIGAIIVAFGSLVSYLTQTQRGMDFVNKVFESAKVIFDVLIDRVSLAGESLFKLFTGDFKGAWDTIKLAVSDLGDEIDRETTRAWQLEDAYQKLQDKQIEFITERAKAERDIAYFREQAKANEDKDNKKALEFLQKANDLQRQLMSTEMELAKEEARISQERVDLGESSRDEIRENAELQAKVFEQQKMRLKLLKSIEAEQLTLTRKINAEKEKDLKKLEKERAEELARYEEQQEAKRLRMIADTEFERELLLEMEEFEDELNERQLEKEKKNAEKRLQIEKRLSQERQRLLDTGMSSIFKIVDWGYNKQEQRISASYKSQLKSLDDRLDKGLISEDEYNTKVQQLERQQARELHKVELSRFRTQKIADIARVAIDTSRAVMKSIAESPLTFGMPWAGYALAQGAIQGGIILGQPEPPAPTFKEGGVIISGKRHSRGGVNLYDDKGSRVANVEDGEGIFVTKREATQDYLSRLNQKHGGRSFNQFSRSLREGGSIETEQSLSNAELLKQLSRLNFVVKVEDIQNGISDYESVKNFSVIS